MTLSAICATSVCLYAAGSSGSGSVSITSPSGVTENFAGLSNTTSPSATLPTGWYLTESNTGAAADGQYVVSTGSGNAGGAYSFGAASAADRALGSLGSGTVTPVQYGAQLANNTGSVITSITISYWGEMWRRGSIDRGFRRGVDVRLQPQRDQPDHRHVHHGARAGLQLPARYVFGHADGRNGGQQQRVPPVAHRHDQRALGGQRADRLDPLDRYR